MKHPLLLRALRVLAVAFSLSLLGGYAWFTQRKAQGLPEAALEASFSNYGTPVSVNSKDSPGAPQTLILSTKSISQPIFSKRDVWRMFVQMPCLVVNPDPFAWKPASPAKSATVTMPGSKSFTGAVTVVASQLQMGASAEPASPASKVLVIPRPGGGNGTVVPGTIDDRIADAQIKPASSSDVVMPGSKIARVFRASQLVPESKGTGRVSTADPASNAALATPEPQAAPAPAKVSKSKMMPGSKSGVLEPEFLWMLFVRMPSDVVNPDPFAPVFPMHSPPPPLTPAGGFGP